MDMNEVARRLDAQAKAIRELRAKILSMETGATRAVERELTASARRRLARGAKSGAGTDICATCKKVKEASRLNSNRCKSCDNK